MLVLKQKQLSLPGFVLGYFVLAKFSMYFFSVQPNNISLLWLPAGFALYFYHRWGNKLLPWVFVASFAANLQGLRVPEITDWLLHTTVSGAVDTLFVLLAGTALAKLLPNGANRPLDLFVFFVGCCALPCLVVGTLLGANLYWGGYLNAEQAIDTGLGIFMADTLGALLIAPLLKAWSRKNEETNRAGYLWITAGAVATAAMVLSFFFGRLWLYMSIPALIFLVIGSKSIYSYGFLTFAIMLYNGLYARFSSFDAASSERLEVLMFSLSLTFALQAMSIQQRSLHKETQERSEWQSKASTDTLTGLANRSSIEAIIDHEIERIKRRQNGTFCLAMVDIDYFKRVNDTYGHNAGDAVLKELSKLLLEQARASDVVSRHGGEEFLVFLPATDKAGSLHVMERLRKHIEAHTFDIGSERLRITVSIGVAEYSGEQNDSYHLILERADRCMYQSKRDGRNRVSG